VCNISILSIYFKNYKGLESGNYYRDGWPYLINCLIYDLIIIPTIIFAIKEKQNVSIYWINFILQNFIVFSITPSAIPIYGMILNIFLIFLTLLVALFERNKSIPLK
jgi:hypothetical protein